MTDDEFKRTQISVPGSAILEFSIEIPEHIQKVISANLEIGRSGTEEESEISTRDFGTLHIGGDPTKAGVKIKIVDGSPVKIFGSKTKTFRITKVKKSFGASKEDTTPEKDEPKSKDSASPDAGTK